MNYTILQISAPIYWGFQHEIPNSRLEGMKDDELVTEVKNAMKTFFHIHNLLELKEGVDKLELHIHQKRIPGQVIYLCNHSN
jgi:hypothetical protein